MPIDQNFQEVQLRKLHMDNAYPPAEMIGYLPRVWCRACRDARGGHCDQHQKIRNCPRCHSNISSAHIDIEFLGHADVTRILLEADPFWSWEPVAWTAAGEPLIMARGNDLRMWGRLTVHGVTRLGVGTVAANSDDAEKQLIGDFIRNAAMRFGIAVGLWSKSERPVADDDDQASHEAAPAAHEAAPQPPPATQAQADEIASLAAALDDGDRAAMRAWADDNGLDLRHLTEAQAAAVLDRLWVLGEQAAAR